MQLRDAGVEWDPNSTRSNARKHGVDFADAAVALEDLLSITIEDPDADNENEYITMGIDPNGRILVTAFMHRDRSFRIVSCRKASRRERRRYEGLR